jgi:hypothetical protein
MIGAIAILVIAFWYFKTAEGRHLSALPWITAGVAVYYLSFAAWMYWVLKPLLGVQFKDHGIWLGLAMDLSSVLVGIVITAIFRAKIMLKQGHPPFQSPF